MMKEWSREMMMISMLIVCGLSCSHANSYSAATVANRRFDLPFDKVSFSAVEI